MDTYLISVKKPYTDFIRTGAKRIEWRKSQLPFGEYFIYETITSGGGGMIIGKATIRTVSFYEKCFDVPAYAIDRGCVSRRFLYDYVGKEPIYGHELSNVVIFKNPRPLSEFCKPCEGNCLLCTKHAKALNAPPQSWCRVIDSKKNKIERKEITN